MVVVSMCLGWFVNTAFGYQISHPLFLAKKSSSFVWTDYVPTETWHLPICPAAGVTMGYSWGFWESFYFPVARKECSSHSHSLPFLPGMRIWWLELQHSSHDLEGKAKRFVKMWVWHCWPAEPTPTWTFLLGGNKNFPFGFSFFGQEFAAWWGCIHNWFHDPHLYISTHRARLPSRQKLCEGRATSALLTLILLRPESGMLEVFEYLLNNVE